MTSEPPFPLPPPKKLGEFGRFCKNGQNYIEGAIVPLVPRGGAYGAEKIMTVWVSSLSNNITYICLSFFSLSNTNLVSYNSSCKTKKLLKLKPVLSLNIQAKQSF